jgi:serine-type D-Ala-D-Ala carboxypeptidase (penicillin-binding protein 5/6)
VPLLILALAVVGTGLALGAQEIDGVGTGTRAQIAGTAAAGLPGPVLDAGTAPVTTPGKTLRLAGPDPLSASLRLRTRTRAGVAFDLDSGQILWRRGAEKVLPIASLTKLMTGLLVVEATTPRQTVKITRAVERVGGSRMGYLRKGRRVRVEALLHGLMMSSGNDAAVALATHVSGSERAFVRVMNRRARNWGLTCTRFVNSHGLASWNRSCPADIAELAVKAMAQPRLARIAAKRSTRVRIGRYGRRWLSNTNPLVRAEYPGALGLKTGYTVRAGRCLVAVVRQGAHRRGVVLLHSGDPGAAARRVFAATRRLP